MTRAGLAVTQAWLAGCTAYLLALLGAAARHLPARGTTPAGEPLRVAVLVPAHDEEEVIAATIASLRAQDHPPGLVEVIVIADNCSDTTACVARDAGAAVWERDVPDSRGKGRALAWAIERLEDLRPDVEAVAIVDADCIASANLCRALDEALRSGTRAAQAADVVANPAASTTSALRWAGFALVNLRARGKARLGLSCGLLGTGMAFRTDLLREHPWSGFSVTEDREHHLALVAAGERVAFVEAARVCSPMPTTAAAEADQQLRWEAGNARLARRAPRLLAGALARRDRHLAHAAAEQLIPPQSILLAAATATTVAALALGDRRLIAAGILTVTGQATFVIGGLAVAGAPRPVWRALAHSPVLVVRKLAQLVRIIVGGGPAGWVRTPRG